VLPLIDRQQALWWLLFTCSLFVAMLVWVEIPLLDAWWSLVVCGLLSLPAVHGLVRRPFFARLAWPVALGRYAMVIYLFNTLAIGATKALLIRAGYVWDAAHFLPHLAAAMAAGIAVPILLKRLVLRHVPLLDRLTN